MKQPASSRRRELDYRKRGAQGADAPADAKPGGGDTRESRESRDKPKADKAERRRYLRQYREWLWPYRWRLAGVFVLAVITAALDMAWPLAIKQVIDVALPAGDRRQLGMLGLGIAAVLVVRQALDSWYGYRLAVLNSKIVFRLRRALFDRFLHLSLTDLAEMKSGGITSRLASDVENVSGLVKSAMIVPGVALIRVALTIGVLLFLSWQLAVAALVAMPPLALASFLWLRRVRPIYRSMQQDRTEVDARVNETFGGIRVVRTFRREPREELGYALGHHTIIRKNLYAQRLEMVLEGAWGLLVPGTSLLIVWLGGWLVLKGSAKVGDIFAFQIYAVLLLQPLWQIVASVSQTQRALAAMERVFQVMGMTPDKPDAPGAADAPARVAEMRFEGVGFAYRPGTEVVRDFDLVVPGGATVALVGPSGAGKTTLTDLVARFHDPTRGVIRLNGVDLRDLRLAGYRRLLAVVQQDVFLFDGTVRENIAYGRRDAGAAAVEDAARRANAHGFIGQLPEGYDTLIGERGFKLSGGQRQRLSIARAILADPQILILDEATSNLDTESEQLIQASLADLFRGRTTFVIAHRLSTVTHADVIVAMDEGRVVEVGRHEELMGRRGFYFEMVERQRDAFGVGEGVPAGDGSGS